MTKATPMKKLQPEGWPTVIPRIITPEPEQLVRFVKEVFGGAGEFHENRPAEIRIGDSLIMISDGGGLREAMPAFLYVYVENVDETYRRAVEAGAAAFESPSNQRYGDRRATVTDRWGNLWQIATRVKRS